MASETLAGSVLVQRLLLLDDDELGKIFLEASPGALERDPSAFDGMQRRLANAAAFVASLACMGLASFLRRTPRADLEGARTMFEELARMEDAALATQALALYEGETEGAPESCYDAADAVESAFVERDPRRPAAFGAKIRAHLGELTWDWLEIPAASLPDPELPRPPRDHFALEVLEAGHLPLRPLTYPPLTTPATVVLEVTNVTEDEAPKAPQALASAMTQVFGTSVSASDVEDVEARVRDMLLALAGPRPPVAAPPALPTPPADTTPPARLVQRYFAELAPAQADGAPALRIRPRHEREPTPAPHNEWTIPWSERGPSRPILHHGPSWLFAAQGVPSVLGAYLLPLPEAPLGEGGRWTFRYRTDRGAHVRGAAHVLAITDGGFDLALDLEVVSPSAAPGGAPAPAVRSHGKVHMAATSPIPALEIEEGAPERSGSQEGTPPMRRSIVLRPS